jgi:hypothetical protein
MRFFASTNVSAAQKQNPRALPITHGSPSFRASTARPGIQEAPLDSRLRGNDGACSFCFHAERLRSGQLRMTTHNFRVDTAVGCAPRTNKSGAQVHPTIS